MKRMVKKFLSLFLLPLFVICIACNRHGNALRVGTTSDYKPFSYIDENGKLTGFEIELMEEIGKHLGKKVVFQDMSFDGLVAAVSTKAVDAAIASIAITPERSEQVSFSAPYYKSPTIGIFHIDNTSTTLDDLQNNRLIVQFGTYQEAFAHNYILAAVKKPELTSLGKIGEIVQTFKSDKGSVVLVDEAAGNAILKSNPDLSVKLISLEDGGPNFSIALEKNSPLVQQIDDALALLEKDGKLAELKSKYNLS